MSFWELTGENLDQPVLIESDGHQVSRSELIAHVSACEVGLDAVGTRTLGFLLCSPSKETVALYLACLRRGHVPLLLDANLPADQLDALVGRYRPQWLAGKQGEQGLTALPNSQAPVLHPALSLLLSTSGSTGSPRLVRLTREALQANAQAIVEYLGIGASDRAITTLPMNYSYGLSVLNSHLLAGASLVLNADSVMTRDFLERVRAHSVTSVAGVPYVHQMLHRTGFFTQALPRLHTITQAGGKLDDRLTRHIATHAKATGRRFFVMYGQTEACARISYVPPDRLLDKIGSIGIPIPGGKLSLSSDNQELIYEGPNVMMGYAETREDLARGDDLHGRLATGDVARTDDDGFFYITGRLKRFIKVSGNRIGLDEVEQALQEVLQVPVAASGKDDRLVAWIEGRDPTLLDQAREHVRNAYGIHHSMTQLRLVEQLPLLPTGKKDYAPLLAA